MQRALLFGVLTSHVCVIFYKQIDQSAVIRFNCIVQGCLPIGILVIYIYCVAASIVDINHFCYRLVVTTFSSFNKAFAE